MTDTKNLLQNTFDNLHNKLFLDNVIPPLKWYYFGSMERYNKTIKLNEQVRKEKAKDLFLFNVTNYTKRGYRLPASAQLSTLTSDVVSYRCSEIVKT